MLSIWFIDAHFTKGSRNHFSVFFFFFTFLLEENPKTNIENITLKSKISGPVTTEMFHDQSVTYRSQHLLSHGTLFVRQRISGPLRFVCGCLGFNECVATDIPSCE